MGAWLFRQPLWEYLIVVGAITIQNLFLSSVESETIF